MARLATYVHVHDKDGVAHVFGPDDEVPTWAARAITNPAAWAEAPAGEPEPAYPAGEPSEAWKVPQLTAYARDKGIDLGEARKKDEILALILAPAETGGDDDESADTAAADD